MMNIKLIKRNKKGTGFEESVKINKSFESINSTFKEPRMMVASAYFLHTVLIISHFRKLSKMAHLQKL